MAISMTKLSSADYYLDRTREALQADGAIPDEATPGPLTGPDPAAYYNAEGNPPGRWIGSASRLLGGETGRQAGAETVRMLINERRNPETGRSLDQAGIRADNDGQPPIAGYDLTQTVPKSVSILWAFADQDTRRAIDECLHQAADMTIGYFEAEYAATRAGAGGVASTACDGVAGFAFDHWDSRDGDPHPHTHLVISNRVRRTTDGQWTALDGRAVYGATVELSEYNANLVKDLLTQRLGWAWHEPARARGRGTRAVAGEVQGVPEELIDAFSGRDREIETRLAAIIDEEERRTGHTIGWKRRAELHKQVWLETRKPKTDARPGLAELTRRWHGKLRAEAPGTSIDAMWQAVDSHRDRTIELGQTASRAAGIRLAGQLADHQTPGRTELERLADAAMAHTERTRATWTLSNIRAEAERLLADIRLDPTARADTANQVAELAIRRCVKITPTRYRAGQAGDDPALVSRAGRSTFDDPTLDRYTSQTILDMEKRVMATFGRTDPLAWGPGEGTRLIQSMRAGGNRLSDDQAKAAAYLLENPHAASALIGPAGTGKTTTMRAVARAWETRHGRGSVLGLTLSVRARDELADSIGTNAITIAKLLDNVSERHRAQTDDLRREYRCRLAAARTPAERDRIRRAISESDAREQAGLIHPGQLVIVDEAGMVGTPELDAIAELCERAGARLALTGDPMQLDAPAAPGGLLVWAEREHRCATLTSLWRFRSDPGLWANDPDGGRARWADEGKATLRLRAGGDRAKPDSVEACRRLVAEYAAHHRLHWGEDRECEEEAYRMTLQWQKTGKTTLLVAGTNEQVRAMNQRTILERRVLGLSDGDPSRLATLSDGLKIGAGDRIVSRANDHQVRGPDGHRIENGMAFTVTRIDTDAIACRDADGRQWTIPRDWAKTNCEAGYATTIHKSQGMTVDRCAAMFPSDARVPCNLQYVAATRGREENHLLYACKDEKTRQTEAMLSGSDTDPEAIARQRMLSTLLTRPDTRTATETRIDEHEERYSLTRLLREHDYAAGLIAGPHLEAKLRQCHNPGIVSMITRSPNWEWLRALWSRAWMTDPKRAMAIVSRDISPKDEHGNRQDPAAVMAGRLSSGLLDRLNGAVRDDWTAGIIPPIKASRNTAALDLVRQNELLITQRADALARQAATGEQPWSRTVMETARKHGDHNLLRDVAVYRDMWHIDDPDQPIGQRPPGRSGRQEQHWCNLDARITGQGSGVVNPGKTRKANRNRPENPTPRVETPNPAAMEERNPQWKTRQEPSSNNSPDGPTQ